MSMATCFECHCIIDTDEDPDACVVSKSYSGKTDDVFLCEICREELPEEAAQ